MNAHALKPIPAPPANDVHGVCAGNFNYNSNIYLPTDASELSKSGKSSANDPTVSDYFNHELMRENKHAL